MVSFGCRARTISFGTSPINSEVIPGRRWDRARDSQHLLYKMREQAGNLTTIVWSCVLLTIKQQSRFMTFANQKVNKVVLTEYTRENLTSRALVRPCR